MTDPRSPQHPAGAAGDSGVTGPSGVTGAAGVSGAPGLPENGGGVAYPGAGGNQGGFGAGFGPATSAETTGVIGAEPGIAAAPEAPKSTPRSWSTGAVVALTLVGAVLASGVTAQIMSSSSSSSAPVENSLNSVPQPGTSPQEPAPEGSMQAVAEKVLPSVVTIAAESATGAGEGSGSILSSDGLILTNNHVVDRAREGGRIEVRLTDGRMFPATVVGADARTDIAVIKAEGAEGLQPIAIGDSDHLRVGEPVLAVGAPLGLSATVTEGIISALNRPTQATGKDGGEASLIDAIQTDASINPGNSGGALVNMRGELIGVPSVIASYGGGLVGGAGSIGLGFAIPSLQAQDLAKQLIETGRVVLPIIGARINTASPAFGAEVAAVTPGSPAEKAGLRSGDIVTKVGDRVVENGIGLIAAVRSHKVGDTITLTVTDPQGRNEHTIEVTLVAEDA